MTERAHGVGPFKKLALSNNAMGGWGTEGGAVWYALGEPSCQLEEAAALNELARLGEAETGLHGEEPLRCIVDTLDGVTFAGVMLSRTA